MRIIVSDTGPLLHLAEAKALDLLKHAGEVHISETVDKEFRRHSINLSLDAEVFLDNLIYSSLWLSPRVIAEARLALTRIYS